MACNWRIRHKLMLGMALVVAVMALLLGGTLHGLGSYRKTMGTCESKLEEIEKAVLLKEEILRLSQSIPEEQQAQVFKDRCLPKIKEALADYKVKLKETIDRDRTRDGGRQEKEYVEKLNKDLAQLEKAIDDELKKVIVRRDGERTDLLSEQSEVRKTIELFTTDVNDLIGIMCKDLRTLVAFTKNEARKSILLLVSTSILAVLMMAGLLRFFHRWVAQPIRDLELGVGRVARGDFDHHIDIKSGDEIEDLAKSYNDMTDKLREMYGNLAQQVNERSRQLVRSERLASVGFLAAGVAHEINNPLGSIAFCGEALESRLAGVLKESGLSALEKETIAKYLKMIQEEAFRCKEITEKLLTFSRGGERTRENTNLAEVVTGVLDVVQHLQNCKGKRIEFKPSGPIQAWTNSQEIKQVFLNLVVNALESMDEGGLLAITHAERDGMVELTFKDSGCGMTAEVLDNIFEPFFTRSRTGKGTGLGLSICHRIITQNGGDIEASSEGPNRGSTFRLRLPIQPPPNASESGQDVQDPEKEFLKMRNAQRNAKAA